MTTLDYDNFDKETLLKIYQEIPLVLKKRDKAELNNLKSQIQQMVENKGFTLDDVLTGNSKSTKTKKAAPKYEKPGDPSTTWTGRGRKPLWVVAALEEGKELDDLKISK